MTHLSALHSKPNALRYTLYALRWNFETLEHWNFRNRSLIPYGEKLGFDRQIYCPSSPNGEMERPLKSQITNQNSQTTNTKPQTLRAKPKSKSTIDERKICDSGFLISDF